MSGRTEWVPKDAAYYRRGRVVRLGRRHGPAGLVVIDWLILEARTQNRPRTGDGTFKAGYDAIAHGCHLGNPGNSGEPSGRGEDHAREIVATLVELGLLDDFTECDQWTFEARISGWHADVNLPLDAARKAKAPRTDGVPKTSQKVPEDPGASPEIPTDPPAPNGSPTQHDKTRKKDSVERGSTGTGDVEVVFNAWRDARSEFNGRKSTAVLDAKRRRIIRNALKLMAEGGSDDPVADCVDAVRGWRHSPHHTGRNETHTVYNDLELLLRDAAHIENFRDLERAAALPRPGSDEEMRRFRERQQRKREQRLREEADDGAAA